MSMMWSELNATCPPPGLIVDESDVVEFQFFLTNWQAEALVRASQKRGMTAAQMARRAIAEFLARVPPTREAGAMRPIQ
jgi:hypothetical protein